MPIFPVRQQVSRKMLAALLLPAWLQMQSNPTGSSASLKAGLKELEKVLED
jgi:hypothetical protein